MTQWYSAYLTGGQSGINPHDGDMAFFITHNKNMQTALLSNSIYIIIIKCVESTVT